MYGPVSHSGIHTHRHSHTHTHAHAYTHTHTHTHAHTHTRTHTAHTHTHTHTHARAHTHAHTHAGLRTAMFAPSAFMSLKTCGGGYARPFATKLALTISCVRRVPVGVCVRACAYVHACVRACMRLCACVRAPAVRLCVRAPLPAVRESAVRSLRECGRQWQRRRRPAAPYGRRGRGCIGG